MHTHRDTHVHAHCIMHSHCVMLWATVAYCNSLPLQPRTTQHTVSATLYLLPQSLHQRLPTCTSQMLSTTTASTAHVCMLYHTLHRVVQHTHIHTYSCTHAHAQGHTHVRTYMHTASNMYTVRDCAKLRVTVACCNSLPLQPRTPQHTQLTQCYTSPAPAMSAPTTAN